MKFPGQLVFGLDIGTRSIVGTVGYRTGGKFHVVTQSIREHQTRAMLDGQIHDIYKVGGTIKEVKAELEERIGRTLKDVCIAAAGRVLQTVTLRVDQDLEGEREVSGEDIYALDSLGVERAYAEFLENNSMDMKFYCVGYSVVRYYMNGYTMGNLEGHKAKTIGEDLIATFLPEDVVDGLYKAVGVAGLDVVNLTLEPIAAIQVAIPEMYRMLNIALVDVGAGTSDISVTRDGSIIAYGMIPIAGDSLTEVVAKHCLVDFSTAEQIKRETGVKDVIEYKDIMGLTQTITTEEVERVAADVIDNMTTQVADKIKELNGNKSVSAVFVVGGGGKLPGYTEALAKKLDIQSERVAVRGEEVMKDIAFLEEDARRDSLMVTPIGICLSYYEQSNNFIFVYFNEQRVKIYDNSKAAVVDAAMQAEFASDGLFPKRGKELNFTVNGKPRIVRGEPGEAAQITVNGNEADIYTLIHPNDQIRVIESTAGDPAKMTLGQLPEFGSKMWVEVNDKKVDLPKFASVNGELQSEYYEIQENDEIEILGYYTVRQISEFMDVVIDWNMNIYVNNKVADMETKVYENFSVIWTLEELHLSDVEMYEQEQPAQEKKTVDADRPAGTAGFSMVSAQKAGDDATPEKNVSEEAGAVETAASDAAETTASNEAEQAAAETAGVSAETTAEQEQEQPEEKKKGARIVMGPGVRRAEEEAKAKARAKEEAAARAKEEEDRRKAELLSKGVPTSIIVTVNGEQIKLSGKKSYVFVDVFEYIDFDLSKPQGSGIVTHLNGREAEYMESIRSGDVIEIYWKH
ncbi:MAG: cell division protein FtsA [Lachnospiraceae bacterium]|nr:cell division protein FtsA [Lachnospiraceae bacterium]